MMWLLETTSVIYNVEFIVNDLQKIFEACLLFQILQLIAQRPITSIYEKNPKYSLTKVYEKWKLMANMCC